MQICIYMYQRCEIEVAIDQSVYSGRFDCEQIEKIWIAPDLAKLGTKNAITLVFCSESYHPLTAGRPRTERFLSADEAEGGCSASRRSAAGGSV